MVLKNKIPKKQTSQQGFSLAVIAFAVFAFGAVFLMQMMSKPQANLVRVDDTREKIAVIQKAFESYFEANSGYPCPADSGVFETALSYGVSKVCKNGLTCDPAQITCSGTVAIGTVPTRTLNLPDSYMYDQWGNRFTYAMDVNRSGGITVKSISGAATRNEDVYLISHGPNGFGAYNRNGLIKTSCPTGIEQENCDRDAIFTDDYWKKSAGEDYSFDDLNLAVNASTVTPFFTFKTTSTAASFNPSSITFPSSDLVWTCEDGCTGSVSGTGNSPSLDLSGSGAGVKTIKVESASAFAGLTELGLISKNLTEFFGEADRALNKVTHIRLINNQITLLGEKFGEIGSTGNGLETVDISSNLLASLPASIGGLKYNQALSNTFFTFSGNRFTTLPPEIGDITGLRGAFWGHDNLLTSLPPEIGGLTMLTSFSLRDNELTTLPNEIGNVGSAGNGLRSFTISKNQLTSLPASIGNLKFDETIDWASLDLSRNKITSIPTEIGNIEGLAGILKLDTNLITSLPAGIGGLTKLHTFDVTDNRLTALPDEIVDIGSEGTGLKVFNIGLNNIAALPTNIGDLEFDVTVALSQLNISSSSLSEAAMDSFINNIYDNRATNFCKAGANRLRVIYKNAGVVSPATATKITDITNESNCDMIDNYY